MQEQRITIHSRTGHQLAAVWFTPEKETVFHLIVAHGFRGTKENAGRIGIFAEKIADIGGSLLAFDFAGSGESEGSFSHMTLSRQCMDFLSVIDYATLRTQGRPIILLGRSFGGTTAIAAAAGSKEVKGMILWSSPVQLMETFGAFWPVGAEGLSPGETLKVADEAGEYELGYEFFEDLDQHDFPGYFQEIGPLPVLIIQGREDETVHSSNAEMVRNWAAGPVNLHIVDGADHRFLQQKELRETLTIAWLRKNCLEGSF